MKLMPALHPEFTLHDDTHLLRVTELMARVMPERVLEEILNPVEIALLILAAHFHDVGMVPDAEKAEQIRKREEYNIFRQNWLIEHVGFNDALRILENKDTSKQDRDRCVQMVAEFEQTSFAHFIRRTHAAQSSEFVKHFLGKDDRLRVGTGHLADSLALLCLSHNRPPEWIQESHGFHYDKAIGTFPVNLAYLAAVLRLADILDFDRERTPEELYRSINFTNQICTCRGIPCVGKNHDSRDCRFNRNSCYHLL
ncbi:MAG: HD domain-containing protein [Limisphaerales bacterium]